LGVLAKLELALARLGGTCIPLLLHAATAIVHSAYLSKARLESFCIGHRLFTS
jgi:hypothetical protein